MHVLPADVAPPPIRCLPVVLLVQARQGDVLAFRHNGACCITVSLWRSGSLAAQQFFAHAAAQPPPRSRRPAAQPGRGSSARGAGKRRRVEEGNAGSEGGVAQEQGCLPVRQEGPSTGASNKWRGLEPFDTGSYCLRLPPAQDGSIHIPGEPCPHPVLSCSSGGSTRRQF